MMSDKDFLAQKYENDEVTEADLSFGRIMPFGKYKGKYIYHLLVKHWRYMDWLINNTSFQLTETEKWWKNKIDSFIECRRADNLIYALCGSTPNLGDENNPHVIVE